MTRLDAEPMFIINEVQQPNNLRNAIEHRTTGFMFDLLVRLVGATSPMLLRARTEFKSRDEELLALSAYPNALGESEVRFLAQIATPVTKEWEDAVIVLDTERCTGTIMLWTE